MSVFVIMLRILTKSIQRMISANANYCAISILRL